MSDNLLVDNISFFRGTAPVLNRVSFEVLPSELFTLYGTNGSGKSTLLRIIAGFIEPDEGAVCWPKAHKDVQLSASYLGHKEGLKQTFTALELIEIELKLAGISCPQKNQIEEMLNHWGLLAPFHTLPLGYLSFGQKRRVAFALMTLKNASLWLLDEPWVGLDDAGRAILAQAIESKCAQGHWIVVTQHDKPAQGRYYALDERAYDSSTA